jgi:glucose-6-phosphate isomerase
MSKEGTAGNDMIQALQEADDEKLSVVLKSQTFTLLEPPIARIARKLHLSQDLAQEAAVAAATESLDLT